MARPWRPTYTPPPTSDLRVQLCGDAHLSNFGAYASPERRLVFDLNDFDETLSGPFEWDVKRLAASLVVAGRDNGFAAQPILDVWYTHLKLEQAIAEYRGTLSAGKLTTVTDGPAADHQRPAAGRPARPAVRVRP